MNTSTVPDKHVRQKQRKTNRTEEVTAEREAFPALFLPDSSHADLGAVSCATRKEDSSQLMLTKTAGVLCVCLSSGIIILMQEIYGSESLSQRYFCLAAAKDAVPEAVLLVHDDSCHLYKYSFNRREARRGPNWIANRAPHFKFCILRWSVECLHELAAQSFHVINC